MLVPGACCGLMVFECICLCVYLKNGISPERLQYCHCHGVLLGDVVLQFLVCMQKVLLSWASCFAFFVLLDQNVIFKYSYKRAALVYRARVKSTPVN